MSNTQLVLVHLSEIIAAIAGSIYLMRYREDVSSRYFVWFLWFTVIVEKLGLIRRSAFTIEYFGFLKDTFWGEPNYWIYNPYLIVSVVFYMWYFIRHISSDIVKKILLFLIIFYLISSVTSFLIVDGQFFNSYSAYNFTIGSIFILLSVSFYFFEVLKSDIILQFNRSITFYIAIGTLIFHLAVTPLFIYSKYYIASSNPEFVKIYTSILTIANIIMYTCYTVGFIVCLRKNKSY